MSRFYVGQRVRIVRVNQAISAPLIGVEAIIKRLGVRPGDINGHYTMGTYADCELDIESLCYPGSCANVNFDQLEPLTDPGRKVVEWSECLWQPSHLTADA